MINNTSHIIPNIMNNNTIQLSTNTFIEYICITGAGQDQIDLMVGLFF
jgi:hypothetical protein